MCFTRRKWIESIRKSLLLTSKSWRGITVVPSNVTHSVIEWAWRKMNSTCCLLVCAWSVIIQGFGSACRSTSIFWWVCSQWAQNQVWKCCGFYLTTNNKNKRKEKRGGGVQVNSDDLLPREKKSSCKVELSWHRLLRNSEIVLCL